MVEHQYELKSDIFDTEHWNRYHAALVLINNLLADVCLEQWIEFPYLISPIPAI